jgi:hypothetical protein
MLTWAAQDSNDSFKFKGTTDEHLFEGRQVSDGGEQCWVLFGAGCRWLSKATGLLHCGASDPVSGGSACSSWNLWTTILMLEIMNLGFEWN